METLDAPLMVALAAVLVAGVAGQALVARRRRSADAARAYLKGFRYILSDEPDAALEELTRAAEVDARTVDTYLALGALFRRTGDHDRAIRLHQNMLLRPGLDPQLRPQIQLELAIDYHRAGMLERAANTYQLVTESSSLGAEAMTRLRQLHEERQDYARAAEVQARLVASGDSSASILAHLLAEAALAEPDPETRSSFAARAVEVEPGNAHAMLARGLVALRGGRLEEAAEWLQRACRADPELAPRAAEPLVEACGSSGSRFFADLLCGGEHPALLVGHARCLRREGRASEAVDRLRRAVELDPRYLEARVDLGRTLLDSGTGDEARRELEDVLAGLRQQEPAFACRSCGQGYSEPQFRCVRCHGWDTVHRGAAPVRPAPSP